MANKKYVRRLDLGSCTICGRAAYSIYDGEAVRLKDGEPLCGHCVRIIRFMYPVTMELGKKRNFVRKDPLQELTSDDVCLAMEQSLDRLEDLRGKHSCHNAVFRIDSVRKENGGLFKPPKYLLQGYVLYGRFSLAENVKLLHDAASQTVCIAEMVSNLMPYGHVGEAGYSTTLTVCQKGLAVQIGDLIVKD